VLAVVGHAARQYGQLALRSALACAHRLREEENKKKKDVLRIEKNRRIRKEKERSFMNIKILNPIESNLDASNT
jgi:hypothetical protein